MIHKWFRGSSGTRQGRLLLLLAAAVLSACFLNGCARGGLFKAEDYYRVNGSEPQETESQTAEEPAPSAPEDLTKPEKVALSGTSDMVDELEDYRDIMQTVWIAYWDGHIAEALEKYGDAIENICVFAASYDASGRVFLPEEMIQQLELIRSMEKENSWNYYLSVTNDIVTDGWTSAKDVNLLYNLMSDPKYAKEHAESLVSIAEEYGFDGVEIDFESLYGDMELWKYFLGFEEALIEETGKRSMPLRIVLEPGTPKEGLTFPEGPEYVMMCYDLHGFGTEPGAKADKDFLIGLVNDFSFIPDLSFALANGGFDWNLDTGYVTTLSEQNVSEILEKYEFDKQRGDTSLALHGVFEDSDKERHEVWYADTETLLTWYEYLCEAAGHPVRCSLWKL